MAEVFPSRTPEAMRRYSRLYAKTDKGKFRKQRDRARVRNIEWNLTFEEWRDWWGDDFCKRGKEMNALCMGRINDRGAYELGNIIKITMRENLAQANVTRYQDYDETGCS